jgi:hypothetical protein
MSRPALAAPILARGVPRLPLTVLLGALALAGCVTVDGVLKADGSGALDVTYDTLPSSAAATEKQRFTSSQVKLESLTLTGQTVHAKLSFDDPAKLSTLEYFQRVRIKRQRQADEERLVIMHRNRNPAAVKDQGKPGPRINLTLPGKVRSANRGATVDGNRVTWSIKLVDLLKEKTLVLKARYRISPEQAPAAEVPKESGAVASAAGKK